MTSERFHCARVGLVTRSDCAECFRADPRCASEFLTRAICASAHGRWLDVAAPPILRPDDLPESEAIRVA
ncbi:MAG: hypothetical protein CME06_16565 [Gemmatimonadetes bacterium]|nr:hypothetical protein [Gemmatimonadota bacterium]